MNDRLGGTAAEKFCRTARSRRRAEQHTSIILGPPEKFHGEISALKLVFSAVERSARASWRDSPQLPTLTRNAVI